jgi:hypothetical protein
MLMTRRERKGWMAVTLVVVGWRVISDLEHRELFRVLQIIKRCRGHQRGVDWRMMEMRTTMILSRSSTTKKVPHTYSLCCQPPHPLAVPTSECVVWCGVVWMCGLARSFFWSKVVVMFHWRLNALSARRVGAVPPCRQYVIKGCDESSTLGVAWKRCVSHSHGSCFKEKHS